VQAIPRENMEDKMKAVFLSTTLAILILPNYSHALSFCVELKKGKVVEGSTIKLRTRCARNEKALPVALLTDIPIEINSNTNNNASTEIIDLNKTIQIGGSKIESIGNSSTQTIGSNLSEFVGGSRDTTIGNSDTFQIGANKSDTIGSNYVQSIGNSRSTTIGNSDTHTVGSSYDFSCGSSATELVGGNFNLAVGGSTSISTVLNTQLISNNQTLIQSGNASILLDKNGDIQINGRNITIKATGQLSLKGAQIINN
jgi:type VI secretion system secreted protein VgrG